MAISGFVYREPLISVELWDVLQLTIRDEIVRFTNFIY